MDTWIFQLSSSIDHINKILEHEFQSTVETTYVYISESQVPYIPFKGGLSNFKI